MLNYIKIIIIIIIISIIIIVIITIIRSHFGSSLSPNRLNYKSAT